MTIGDICTRQVVCTARNATIAEAAELMRTFHVGTLVVADGTNGDDVVPVGLITDRDIVVGVVASRLDASSMLVGEIMNPLLLIAEEDDDVFETVQQMSARGIRRLPVVDTEGKLAGIVAQDDLYSHLSQELAVLATISQHQQVKEAIARA